MRVLFLVELLFAAFFLYGLLTQIILPLWRETSIFPWLDAERKLTHEYHDARQEVREAELERDIYFTKKDKKAIKASTKKKGYKV